MRFYTYLIHGREEACVSFNGGKTIYTLDSLDIEVRDLQEMIQKYAKIRPLLEQVSRGRTDVSPIDLKTSTLLAPIVHPQKDVLCLGINYTEHAIEAGSYSRQAFGMERPATIYFSKRVYRASGSGEAIPAYTGYVDSLDYESELGVVIGRDIRGIRQEEAMDAVFGYTVMNDVSARNLQTRHQQWLLGKSLDGFLPMGPCIVTPEELGDPTHLMIRSYVNGELRQNSNTSLMLQTIAGAIAELSAGMTLQAGTLIATGTPAGVGMGMKPPTFLKPGDEVTCEIEGIGRISNPVRE